MRERDVLTALKHFVIGGACEEGSHYEEGDRPADGLWLAVGLRAAVREADRAGDAVADRPPERDPVPEADGLPPALATRTAGALRHTASLEQEVAY